jgi:hypothetical protein
MVLLDMNCAPPEFIRMVHEGKDAVPGGEGEDAGTFSCNYSKFSLNLFATEFWEHHI